MSEDKKQIFLLEDDGYLREGLCEILTMQGYQVDYADLVEKARSMLKNKTYDLLILDVTLPDGNGRDLCNSLRADGCNTPILMLTANDEEMDICRGLDAGADDYVTKPFQLLVLMSRIRALLRRSAREQSAPQPVPAQQDGHFLESGDIFVDLDNMTAKKAEELLFLTKTEFQLLTCLMRNQGHIVTREFLLQNIWDDNGSYIDNNTLSVHMSRLREKIGKDHIQTVRGVGYGWKQP